MRAVAIIGFGRVNTHRPTFPSPPPLPPQPDLRMHTTLPADSQDQGIVSMAGRVPPSRPTTALAANRTPPTYPASPQSAAASPYNPTTPTSSSASAGAGTNGGGATAAAAGGSSGSSRPGSAKLWPTGRGRDPLLRERPASAGFGMYRCGGALECVCFRCLVKVIECKVCSPPAHLVSHAAW